MSPSQHTPLDAEERALADALARLPTPQPSAELDARILAQARVSTRPIAHPTRHRRLRWWTASMGSAAVAVLAAGIAWQSGLLRPAPTPEPSPLPHAIQHEAEGAKAPAAPRAVAGSEAPEAATASLRDESSAVDFDAPAMDLPAHRARAFPAESEPQGTASAVMQKQDAASDQARSQRSAREQITQEAAAPPSPAPAPAKSAPAPAPTVPEEPARAGVVLEEAPMAVPPPPAAAPAPPAHEAALHPSADALANLPAWQDDAALAPDAWLTRIRERLHAGDRLAATASLRRFVTDHPGLAVPEDLSELLRE